MLTDLAKKPAMTLQQLERIVGDISLQPLWRVEADRAADYYDDKQLEPDVIREMEERGQPVLIHNLIKPAINGVLGMEAKTRTDWLVSADSEDGLEVAEALNEKLNEAARITRADRACADAYAAEVKTGLGWVEVGRNPDPTDYGYRVNYIHRREIFWDWHAQQPDLSDARWLMRRKWLEVDELVMSFPQHKELIEAVANGFQGLDPFHADETLEQSQELMGAYTTQSQTSIPEDEWWDPDRKRALTSELYYRVWERKTFIKTVTGELFEYDKSSRLHNAALAAGKAEVFIAPVAKMRLAFFVGPHRLADLDSPHPHNRFPYVPFWGYREDRTGIPYGMIRSMMPAQDEINKRRSKLTWLLNAKLIIKDDDAVLDMSDDELADAVHSGTGVITLNPTRKQARGLSVETDMGIAQQQFTVMQEAEKMIEDVAGVYSAFLGKEGGADSGVAIDSLIEQGNTTLAELNDNYRYARQQVGELILAHIVQDLGDQQTEVRTNVNKPHRSRTIRLNERHEDGGRTKISNAVKRTKTRVVLSDIANTHSYRQQMARQLMEMAGQLPEQYQGALIDLIIEMSDIPNRDEVLKRIRQVSGQGVNPEDLTEEEREQMQRKQQLAQEIESLELENKRNEVQKLAAEVRDLNARADERNALTPAERQKVLADAREKAAQVKKIAVEVAQARRELLAAVDKEIELEQKQLPSGIPEHQVA